jgi:hypothetical protein
MKEGRNSVHVELEEISNGTKQTFEKEWLRKHRKKTLIELKKRLTMDSII